MAKKLLPTRWTLRRLLTAPKGAPLQRITKQLERSVRALEALRPLLADNIKAADFTRMLRLTEELAERRGCSRSIKRETTQGKSSGA